MPSSVFISYCHRDKRHLDRVLVHLQPLARDGLSIEPWSDRKIAPGDQWETRISSAIAKSKVAVLLVSADFLASEFIMKCEWPRILRRARDSRIKVLPVVLSPCSFSGHGQLASFQAVNDPSRPIVAIPIAEREKVWNRLRQAVEACLDGQLPDEGWRVVNERIVLDTLRQLAIRKRSSKFAIFSSSDAYVQVLQDIDSPRFECEATSNEFLPESRKLSESSVRKLRAFGFRLSPRDGGNFKQVFHHGDRDADLRTASRLIVKTLATVYGANRNEQIAVSGSIISPARQ